MCDLILKIIKYFISNLAAICSAVCAVLMYINTKRMDKFAINSSYHRKIFDKYLIDKIPNTRNYIRYDSDSQTIKDSSEFTDVLENLRKDIMFYKYYNKSFYDRLSSKIQDIVDFTMKSCNKKIEEKDYYIIIDEINIKTKYLYECISEDYLL